MEVRKKRAEDKVERQLKIPEGAELPTAVRRSPLLRTHGVGLGRPCSPLPMSPLQPFSLGAGWGGAQERLRSETGVVTAPSRPQETVFQEQCEGLLEESGDEEDEEALAAPAESGDVPKPAPRQEKKTEQQRRREKEARALVRGRLRGGCAHDSSGCVGGLLGS